MNLWPNWVDLIVLTLIFTACYKAFARGLLTELFHLTGIVSITCLTINFDQDVAARVQSVVGKVNPTITHWVVFWVVFATLFVLSQLLIRRLSEIVKWERIHWTIQGLALLVGLARGIWVSALTLVVMASSGIEYFQQSVAERSVVGSQWLKDAESLLERTAATYPGAVEQGGGPLIPPAHAPKKSKAKGT